MENTIIINKCGEEIHIDKESRKVVLVVRNGRNYKSARYLNNAYYWGIAEEYFAEVESVEEAQLSTNRLLLAKRYYNNYYSIITNYKII